MKNTILSQLFVFAAAFCVGSASAADRQILRAVPGGGSMKIIGTSTIHDWDASTKLLGGSFTIAGEFPVDAVESAKPGKIEATTTVVILANSFACSSGAAMDKVMRGAMKTDKNPSIKYRLTSAAVAGKADGGGINLATKGNLVVAGVTNSIDMTVVMKNIEGGKVQFSGTAKTKMTDFGIEPPAPSIGLGLIKTADEVTLEFKWQTKKRD
jgi:polyisoprenoid-binding protein YceI